ncbi:MAG: MFS transporter [Bacteroidota bacterium]
MTKERLLFVYTLNQSFHWFIVGLIIPVLSLLQLDKGLNLFQIGVIGALYSGTTLLLELPTGGLADAIGRKEVYLASLSTTFLAVLVIAAGTGFWPVAVGFVLFGIGRALSSGTIDAWFVDEFKRLVPEGNLQKATALVNVFIPIGLCVGALFGGILPMTLGRYLSGAHRLGVYDANLFAKAALLAVQFVLTITLVREPAHADGRPGVADGLRMTPRILRTAVTYGLKKRVVLLLLLTTLAWGFGFAGLENFWQPRVKAILGDSTQTWIFGVLSAGYFLSGSLGSLLVTALCRVFKERYELVLFWSRTAMGALFLALARQKGIAGFSVFYLALFMVNGMTNSPHLAVFHREVPDETRATMLSFDSLCLSAGGLLGALLMGYLADAYSIPASWLVGAGVIGASGIPYLLAARRVKRTEEGIFTLLR